MRPSCCPTGPPNGPPSGPCAVRRRRKMQWESSCSPYLNAGDGQGPRLPRGLEGRDRLAARLQRRVEALRVARLADHRDDRGGLVEGLQHRVIVLVQPVELRLLDLDRRAEAGVPALRVADFRLEAFEREDDVPDPLEALDLAVHRPLVPEVLQIPADAFQLIGQLNAQQVVRRADVLATPIAGVAGDHELDFLEQSSVLFDSVTDVGHCSFLSRRWTQYVPHVCI